MRLRPVAVTIASLLLFAAFAAACGGDDDDSASNTTASGDSAGGKCVVGVSWNNYQEERWAKFDEPAIKEAVEAGGGTYVSNDAKSSAETQASNVENLISQGANVLIILAQDGTAIKPSVANAISNGVPVIAYDRLIEDPGALYLTFDNVEVGRLEAQEIFKARAEGQLHHHQGQQGRRQRRLPALRLRRGHQGRRRLRRHQDRRRDLHGQLGPGQGPDRDRAVPDRGRTTTSRRSCRRTTAWPVASWPHWRLRASPARCRCPVRTVTRPPSTGSRSARRPSSVWKDARTLGKTAGEAAIQLCKDKDVTKVSGTAAVRQPGRQQPHVDPAHAAADHQGQPQRRHRRRLDNQGKRLQGRDSRFGTRLLTGPTSVDVPDERLTLHDVLGTEVRANPWRPRTAPRRAPVGRSLLVATELDTRLLGMVVALAAIWITFNILSSGDFLTPETSGTSRSRARRSRSWPRAWS